MRRIAAYAALFVIAALAVGCTKAETTATKSEQENYANPVKTIPPEAGGPPPAAPAGTEAPK